MPGILLVTLAAPGVMALVIFDGVIFLSILGLIAATSVAGLGGMLVVGATIAIVRVVREERRWGYLLCLPWIWIMYGHVPVGVAIAVWQWLPLLGQHLGIGTVS